MTLRAGMFTPMAKVSVATRIFLPGSTGLVAIEELKLSHHIPDTLLFIIWPHYGNLHK